MERYTGKITRHATRKTQYHIEYQMYNIRNGEEVVWYTGNYAVWLHVPANKLICNCYKPGGDCEHVKMILDKGLLKLR